MAKRKKKLTFRPFARPKIVEKYHTIGVRFISGVNVGKIYTYKVKRSAKVHLGQALVVANDHGTSIVAVVQVDDHIRNTPQHLVEITHKVAPL